eukprot:TRINITY_DN7081_c0_g1_i1.p1 TRINITY_DN7081_c0_g1~~TRINITY_DN7081_c0_g1_i1.p1  ORF type:complete len:353 (-),score=45.93 TRINITY_DN7081_c0_g1_i1:192-1250(-)
MQESQARLQMMELANMLSVPMALNAAVRLQVPDIIWQNGANTPLSCAQIASSVLGRPASEVAPNAANLQRIMRMLSSYNVFSETLTESGERFYSLTEVGRTLAKDESGHSFGEYVLQHHQKPMLNAWEQLECAVIDPSEEPFVKANGKPAYAFYGDGEEYNQLMKDAMTGVSVPFMRCLLQNYKGFQGIRTLVDVGGSSGFCLHMILQEYPEIKGINFDLPYVVENAPSYPGISHVGGNMFEAIPSGDAIFMKWILTTWSDDKCIELLKRCHESLPEGGKVIACEPVLPKKTDTSNRSRALLEGDVFVMTVYSNGGKERTHDEFKQLGTTAGFSRFHVFEVDPFYATLEFSK